MTTRTLPPLELFPGVVATVDDLDRVSRARRISRLPVSEDSDEPLQWCGAPLAPREGYPGLCMLRPGHRGRCDGPTLYPLGRVELPDWVGWAYGYSG